MNSELRQLLIASLNGVSASANFSAEDSGRATINALLKEIGIDENSDSRTIREKSAHAFALIEEVIDEILPKKLESVLAGFAEVKTFPRDAEVYFNIEKIGKNRAKLTISKGARGGIYRAAKLDNKIFSIDTFPYTVGVYVSLEDLILGRVSLAELYSNILEGFEEIIYREVFTALASASSVAGYSRVGGDNVTTVKASLGSSIDSVIPYVKQYGVPTIFGSYQALSDLVNTSATIGASDLEDIRTKGVVQLYKGNPVVELPNYICGDAEWAYDPSFVFVLPSGVKPVKVGLKGDLMLKENAQATGGEKWEAHKMLGVGLAMANNFASIKVTDIE